MFTNRWVVSSTVTFLATFFLTLGGQLVTPQPIEWTATVAVGILMVALRAAFKALIESMAGAKGDL